MKQYLSNEQTAKLIELGFEKPKSIIYASAYQEEEGADPDVEYEYAYSIGELIEMMPMCLEAKMGKFFFITDGQFVGYYSWTYEEYEFYWDDSLELIDNLFDACVELKAEGVI